VALEIPGREAGISAAHLAKARAASVGMTVFMVGPGERTNARATAETGRAGFYIPIHRDETAMNGEPDLLHGQGKNKQRQEHPR
jgi:hypothetical protein